MPYNQTLYRGSNTFKAPSRAHPSLSQPCNGRKTQNAAQRRIFMMVVKTNLYIVKHAQLLEQTDILEGSRDACLD